MSTYSNQRNAYGETLVELGKADPRIVVLDADLCKSTMSVLFQDAFPERFFEMGIAEANMMSTAAGLAVSGKIAFASSFAVFATGRAYDQIRQTISIGKLNVKVCGSSCGLSDYGDGSTHQAIDDVAIMSAIPNMTILTPVRCDRNAPGGPGRRGPSRGRSISASTATRSSTSSTKTRPSKSARTASSRRQRCAPAGPRRDGRKGPAGGRRSWKRKASAPRSSASATMKPFDYEGVAKLARGMKAVVTAEEHSYIGGLAAATALALRRSTVPMDYLAVNDTFGESAHKPGDCRSPMASPRKHRPKGQSPGLRK